MKKIITLFILALIPTSLYLVYIHYKETSNNNVRASPNLRHTDNSDLISLMPGESILVGLVADSRKDDRSLPTTKNATPSGSEGPVMMAISLSQDFSSHLQFSLHTGGGFDVRSEWDGQKMVDKETQWTLRIAPKLVNTWLGISQESLFITEKLITPPINSRVVVKKDLHSKTIEWQNMPGFRWTRLLLARVGAQPLEALICIGTDQIAMAEHFRLTATNEADTWKVRWTIVGKK